MDDSIGSFFLDSETAWVWPWQGTPVWHTQDGGGSWEIVGDLGLQAVPEFADGLHGWKMIVEIGGMVTTNAHILSFATTQDSGQSWQETGQPPGGGYTSLTYLDSQIAWGVWGSTVVSDYGLPDLRVPYSFVATFDGGVSWTSHRVPLPDEAKVVDDPMGTFLDAGKCRLGLPRIPSRAIWKFTVACERASWMYTTANQGTTWIISSMPAGVSPKIEFVSSTTGWLFTNDRSNTPGKLYRTTNGGQSWELLKQTGWTSVRMSFLDEQTGWAVVSDCGPVGSCSWYSEDSALVKTTDGGQTWHEIDLQFLP